MINEEIEPLTTALSFYPRLEFSTQVTEKHAKLVSEKFPGLKIWKNILRRALMDMAISLGIGIVIGIIFSRIVFRFISIGNLRVDHSDPDGPFLFLELSKRIESVVRKKYVVMRVKEKDFIPHE